MEVESGRPNGEVFLDARGAGRAMRLTWHHEADVVVLSLWRDKLCAGTFRLSTADVSDFVDALIEGLRDGPALSGDASTASLAALPDPRSASSTPTAAVGPIEWALGDDSTRAS